VSSWEVGELTSENQSKEERGGSGRGASSSRERSYSFLRLSKPRNPEASRSSETSEEEREGNQSYRDFLSPCSPNFDRYLDDYLTATRRSQGLLSRNLKQSEREERSKFWGFEKVV